jgi:diadenosine tetraphosphatase ApaH/serine/threonine PP2A family protein phosphatase
VSGISGFRYLTGVTRRLAVADLTEPDRRYLASLPTIKQLSLDGRRYLFCHASPRDPLDEYVPTDIASWSARTASLHCDMVCVGHTHQQFLLDADGVSILNPGSLGLQRDGDPRAKYAIIDNGVVTLRQVEYDIEAVVARTEKLPLEERAKIMMVDVYRHGRLMPPIRAAVVDRAG